MDAPAKDRAAGAAVDAAVGVAVGVVVGVDVIVAVGVVVGVAVSVDVIVAVAAGVAVSTGGAGSSVAVGVRPLSDCDVLALRFQASKPRTTISAACSASLR